jgi:hypothetical protein
MMNRIPIVAALVVVAAALLAAAGPSSGSYSLSVGRTLKAANGEGQLIYRIDRQTGRTWVSLAFAGSNPDAEKGGLFAGRWEEFHESPK